jgi:hypothetical protein
MSFCASSLQFTGAKYSNEEQKCVDKEDANELWNGKKGFHFKLTGALHCNIAFCCCRISYERALRSASEF